MRLSKSESRRLSHGFDQTSDRLFLESHLGGLRQGFYLIIDMHVLFIQAHLVLHSPPGGCPCIFTEAETIKLKPTLVINSKQKLFSLYQLSDDDTLHSQNGITKAVYLKLSVTDSNICVSLTAPGFRAAVHV